jgi:hypothetical protein
MMKKTVKLMVAIALATGFGMSAFMESAEAQRRMVTTYSQPGEDEQFVNFQFSLVNATREGIPIDDAAGANDRIGLFIGAIENFAPATGEFCFSFSNERQTDCNPSPSSSPFNQSSRYFYDSSGFPIFRPSDPLDTAGSSFDGNLLAQFVEAGEELYDTFPPSSPAAIAYSIFRADSILGADEPVLTYRLLNLDGLDITQAVNSLEYILENNLLGASLTVIGRFTDSDTGNTITQFGIADALVQNQFEQDVPTTPVPEPDTTIASLLGIGVLGAGSLRKRKVKQS